MPNILRSKSNQTMKFGQLIEYNIRNFFWKTIQRIWWRNLSQTLFWKINIEHISGSKVKRFIQFVFFVCQVESSWNILSQSFRLLSYTKLYIKYIKPFKKAKRDLEPVSLPHFLYNFWRKIFILLYSVNEPSFIVWLPLLCEILGIAIAC